MSLAVGLLPPLLLLAAIALVAILRRRAPTPPLPAGAIAVPVRSLYLRRGALAGATHNSLNPRLAVAPDGLHFRLFRQGYLPFSDISHVELREPFGRFHLLFINSAGPRLLAMSLDRAAAKQLLDLLPRAVALTSEVATLRDGVPTAGAPRLPLYHGPYF